MGGRGGGGGGGGAGGRRRCAPSAATVAAPPSRASDALVAPSTRVSCSSCLPPGLLLSRSEEGGGQRQGSGRDWSSSRLESAARARARRFGRVRVKGGPTTGDGSRDRGSAALSSRWSKRSNARMRQVRSLSTCVVVCVCGHRAPAERRRRARATSGASVARRRRRMRAHKRKRNTARRGAIATQTLSIRRPPATRSSSLG